VRVKLQAMTQHEIGWSGKNSGFAFHPVLPLACFAMTQLQHLKALFWRICHAISPKLEHRLKQRFSSSYWDNWGERTRQAVACPDNAFIPRAARAGRIEGSIQIMHNGLKVRVGSYYGRGAVGLLKKNQGVHEPQEERVFQEVLKQIPSGGVIVELGAYWGFYSMWFCSQVRGGKAYLVEPKADNLARGKENFQLNGLSGHFVNAWVGARSGAAPDGGKMICMDDFVAEQKLGQLSLLHSDIQGAELDMLHGGAEILNGHKVSYTFISTHGEELHAACDQFLQDKGYLLLASVRPAESYSIDGILVHRAPHAPALPPIKLSRKPLS